ncbi:MAG: flavin reductase family protein [Solirubrobacterales bacterium]|nr:flavin reductase family protein [Solirubrobacterales bacterium]
MNDLDPRALRDTLGRFATGVTVVSTAAKGAVHAMTANAFTAVSLQPPLILVSVDNRARMHQMLPDTRRYGVSVLATEQERLAMHFAGRPDPEQPDPFVWTDDTPVVDGAIAHFVCDCYAEHEAGDHTLYVGQVRGFSARVGQPLLFHSGQFARVANEPVFTSWGW